MVNRPQLRLPAPITNNKFPMDNCPSSFTSALCSLLAAWFLSQQGLGAADSVSESGEPHRVSPGFGKTTCAFFRPGTDEVLFASTHLDPDAGTKQKAELDLRATGKPRRYSWDYDEQMDLFSARRDGSHLQRLTFA